MPCAPSIPRGRREPPGELPCAPPALRLHARFLEPWKRQRPRRPTPARPSARMAAPAAPASMDAPRHSSRPPFSRRRPQPSPTPTQIPRVVPRLIREGWLEGPLKLWLHCSSELLQRPVQRRWATTLPPMATCKAQFGTPLTIDTTSTLIAIIVGPAADRHGTTVDDMGAPGPSADADDLVPTPHQTGLSADSSGAPSAATKATRWGMTRFWR